MATVSRGDSEIVLRFAISSPRARVIHIFTCIVKTESCYGN
jgi:hypothetical protein